MEGALVLCYHRKVAHFQPASRRQFSDLFALPPQPALPPIKQRESKPYDPLPHLAFVVWCRALFWCFHLRSYRLSLSLA